MKVCVFFLASVNNHGIKAYHIDGRERIHVHIQRSSAALPGKSFVALGNVPPGSWSLRSSAACTGGNGMLQGYSPCKAPLGACLERSLLGIAHKSRSILQLAACISCAEIYQPEKSIPVTLQQWQKQNIFIIVSSCFMWDHYLCFSLLSEMEKQPRSFTVLKVGV